MTDLHATLKRFKDGFYRVEDAHRRRVRGVLNGEYIFDTLRAVYVWEHKHYPYYYIPKDDFTGDVLEDTGESLAYGDASASAGKITIESKATSCTIISDRSNGPLSGLVKVDFDSIDAWFVEDEQIYVHPKDPYCRIECLPSSRTVRVEVEGEVIAESTANIFLYEKHLIPRYYISPTSVKWPYLTKSETVSFCPYKGEARYYDLNLKGKTIKDAVWYYKYPTAESHAIAGLLCFYNEKVDIFVNGVRE